MKIALIGYGKMGKEIEQIALQRGHEIGLIIDLHNQADLCAEKMRGIDVAIEFTVPQVALENYAKCFKTGVPLVTGTTGWMEQFDSVVAQCKATNSGFFYASNFSLGVNLFFELNKQLARLMNPHDQYQVTMEEIHHTQKLDAPSGTAISLANDLLANYSHKTSWALNVASKPSEMPIFAKRIGAVPGTHLVTYTSKVDEIEIKHTAFNRQGFAMGAVIAAEFMAGKKGVFTMKDLLNL